MLSGVKILSRRNDPSGLPLAFSRILPSSTKPVLEYDQRVPGSKSSGAPAYRAIKRVRRDRRQHPAIGRSRADSNRIARHVVHQIEQGDVVGARQARKVLRNLVVHRQLASSASSSVAAAVNCFVTDPMPNSVVLADGGRRVRRTAAKVLARSTRAIRHRRDGRADAAAARELLLDGALQRTRRPPSARTRCSASGP